MKASVSLLIAAASLGAPTALLAGESPSNSPITAIGHIQRHGWLTVAGPDVRGRYVMRIEIADLDAASVAGWSAMARRVGLGTAILCDTAAERPKIDGYYDAGERACRSDTMAQGQSQMAMARDSALAGHDMGELGFGSQPLSR